MNKTKTNKTYYQTQKEQLREEARSYQIEQSELALSWWEVAVYQDYLLQRAKRFGLVKEFRENGIC